MSDFRFGYKMETEKAEHLKELLKEHFTDKIDKHAWLLWCNLTEKPLRRSYDEIKGIDIEIYSNIYFYLERGNEMYKTDIKSIFKYIDDLEPWVDIDAYIFDDTYKWLMIFTHDDEWLTLGI